MDCPNVHRYAEAVYEKRHRYILVNRCTVKCTVNEAGGPSFGTTLLPFCVDVISFMLLTTRRIGCVI